MNTVLEMVDVEGGHVTQHTKYVLNVYLYLTFFPVILRLPLRSILSQIVNNMTSEEYARSIREQILENATSQDPAYYGTYSSNIDDHGTSHVSVLTDAGDAVSATGTINT